MAKHGRRKSQKRISLGKSAGIARKEHTWITKPSPGPHSEKECVPLGVVLRDLLGIARNMHEAKRILNMRTVSVDGIIRTEKKFPVGLFDVVALADLKKNYRVLLAKKGSFALKEIPAKNSGFKLVKVTGKRAVKGNRIQVNTNDGRVFIIGKEKIGIGDSLKIALPKQKILQVFSLEKGSTAFVSRGQRIGSIAEISEIVPGTMKRGKLVALKPREGDVFQTVAENIFVVGKENVEVEIS